MADFKQRNTTWVLLIDVDEYITFNLIQEDDPSLPLDYAPEGVPTLSRWKKNQYKLPNSNTGQLESDGECKLSSSDCKKTTYHIFLCFGREISDHTR